MLTKLFYNIDKTGADALFINDSGAKCSSASHFQTLSTSSFFG
jgi:hypothetical protein